ncbi:MFS transporter [Immundisolibacter sp.]|uniref:MFS transporter n=1 Tax=Immundisolibacter sp. TaxID=1934948 RepID=UPI0035652D6A
MADLSQSLQSQLDAKPLAPLQWQVVFLCWLVNILDGFDLLAISFAAPSIAKTWMLDPQTLGIVFSSGLVGMTVGSLLLGPAADRIGRRPMIILATTVLGLSTLATAAATSVGQLLLLRCITGIAIGALLPSLNTLVAEYTPDRRRNLAISFMHLGYPVGGIAGGFIASQLIPTAGWEALFLVGGLFTLATVPVLLLGLPESLQYLLPKDQPKARAAADRIAVRLGIDLQAARAQPLVFSASGFRDVLRGPWLAPGVALWTCFFLGNLTLYFLLNWTPTVLVEAGLSSEKAIRAGMMLNLGGGIGMLTLGYLSARWSMYRMMSGFFVMGGVFIIALGQVTRAVDLLFGLTILAGFFSLGGLIGLYSLAARLYPDASRATGIGLALGAGRFGAILGPYAGGVLISLGWPMGRYFALLALPLIAVAAILWRVRPPSVVAARVTTKSAE